MCRLVNSTRSVPQCPLSIWGDAHVQHGSLGPLVEPDVGFSPVRLSDDLTHTLISYRCRRGITLKQTGTIPVEQPSGPGLSNSPYHRRYTSASEKFEVAHPQSR